MHSDFCLCVAHPLNRSLGRGERRAKPRNTQPISHCARQNHQIAESPNLANPVFPLTPVTRQPAPPPPTSPHHGHLIASPPRLCFSTAMDLDPTSIPPRVDPESVEHKDAQTVPLSAHNGSVSSLHGKMHHEAPMPSTWTDGGHETRQFAPQDATPLRDNSPSTATTNQIRRDQAMGANDPDAQTAAVNSASTSPKAPRFPQQHETILSRSNSLGTSSTNETDRVFTPPATGGRASPNNGSTQHSSQESQLLQLSQIAAAQERIPEIPAGSNGNGASSRKRMADGAVKHGRSSSMGHARNTSTVSVASTVGSRVGEVSLCSQQLFAKRPAS